MKDVDSNISDFLRLVAGMPVGGCESDLGRLVSDRIEEIKFNEGLEADYKMHYLKLQDIIRDERAEEHAIALAEGYSNGLTEGIAQGISEGKELAYNEILTALGISREEYDRILKEKASAENK